MLAACCFAVLAVGCAQPEPEPESLRSISETVHGEVDGENASLYKLTNMSGAEVSISEYGGIIVSIKVPDRDGDLGDVALGFDDLAAYVADTPYFGAITGRYANRIADGQFELDGETYEVPKNNGDNALHGGLKGFDKRVWQGEMTPDQDGLVLTYTSEDGEEGYPGTLSSKVSYIWTDDNELRILYEATTDKPTVLNLTNHSYFNLQDGGASSILDHELTIPADRYTPVDAESIPLGEIASLDGSPLDFRMATAIGARIEEENEQLQFGSGYDHNYVLKDGPGELALAATVFDPDSGRAMDVLTTEPGVQFYSGNFLDGHHVGKGGVAYERRSGLCLETQHFPNSPNEPDFPSTELRPGETFQSETVYRFYTK